jgi:hypothetical protein
MRGLLPSATTRHYGVARRSGRPPVGTPLTREGRSAHVGHVLGPTRSGRLDQLSLGTASGR